MNFEEVVNQYAYVQKVSDEMYLVRNSPNEFFRILRRSYNGENANYETYGVRKDYKGNEATPEYQKSVIDALRSNPDFRYKPKNDQDKTNITDAPGFGSVRLSPPFEDPEFDKEFFDFINGVVVDGDTVIDYGGGMSPFIYFLDHGKKFLVDLSDTADVCESLGVKYVDANEWLASENDPSGVLTCFHTLEHTNNPEELIKRFSTFDLFIFATPNEEIIETSKYHHIYMQVDVIKRIFDSMKVPGFLRLSKRNLDIHGIVVNSPEKWKMIKNNSFFNKNFRLYSEL